MASPVIKLGRHLTFRQLHKPCIVLLLFRKATNKKQCWLICEIIHLMWSFFEWLVPNSSFKDAVEVFGWGRWHFSRLAARFSHDLAAQDDVVIFNCTAVWSVFIRRLSLLGNKHICSPSLQGHSASLNWVELSCIGFRSHWRLEWILIFFLLRAQKSFFL